MNITMKLNALLVHRMRATEKGRADWCQIVACNVDGEDMEGGDYERNGQPFSKISASWDVYEQMKGVQMPGVIEVEMSQKLGSKGVSLKIEKFVRRVGDFDINDLNAPVIDEGDAPKKASAPKLATAATG